MDVLDNIMLAALFSSSVRRKIEINKSLNDGVSESFKFLKMKKKLK